MRFHVGQLVRINKPGELWHNEETEVTSIGPATYNCDMWVLGELICEVNLPAKQDGTRRGWVHPRYLVPISDPPELVEWSDCIWQPEGVT
ncbi:MAG: hypothetical protein KDA32_13495 [Phycisphaerales bacterium]|nr:hypothetical protein [Phycisphaerales bacterium]